MTHKVDNKVSGVSTVLNESKPSKETNNTANVAKSKLSAISEENQMPMKGSKGKRKVKVTTGSTHAQASDNRITNVDDLVTTNPLVKSATEKTNKFSVSFTVEKPVAQPVLKKTSSIIAEYEAPIKQNKKLRLRFLVIGLFLVIGATIGIGLLTNFKFDQIKLKDWHWDVLGAAGAVGIGLLVIALLKKSKPNLFRVPENETVEKPVIVKPVKKTDLKLHGDDGKPKVVLNSEFRYVRQGINTR